jgi:hypothetical protein
VSALRRSVPMRSTWQSSGTINTSASRKSPKPSNPTTWGRLAKLPPASKSSS